MRASSSSVGGPSDGIVGMLTELQLLSKITAVISHAPYLRAGRCRVTEGFIDEV
jgi:hypothetical protein